MDISNGCPSLASPAALTKTGREDLYPNIVVDGSQPSSGRMTRALKKNRENARAFSTRAADDV